MAALLLMVVMVAVRLGLPPSKLAMPLAYAGHAGSLLVLTGNEPVRHADTLLVRGEREPVERFADMRPL